MVKNFVCQVFVLNICFIGGSEETSSTSEFQSVPFQQHLLSLGGGMAKIEAPPTWPCDIMLSFVCNP